MKQPKSANSFAKPGRSLSVGENLKVKTALLALAPIPESELDYFSSLVTVLPFTAGHPFVSAGNLAERLGLVLSGLFKVYYPTAEGLSCTCKFSPEGSFIGAYSASLVGTPSRTTTEAIEESIVATLSWSSFRALFDRHPAWDRLGRKVIEVLYVQVVNREENLMTLDAKTRLALFESSCPFAIDRVSKTDIASFLGIRPETLSRLLRAK